MTFTEIDFAAAELAFVTALAAFQAELPDVRKDAEATFEAEDGTLRTRRYAGLPDISVEVLPALGRHGFAFTAQPTLVKKRFVLVYELTHVSGGNRSGVIPLPDPLTTPADEFGRKVSAARRHALTALTGVAPRGREDVEESPRSSGDVAPIEAPVVDLAWLERAKEATTKKDADTVWAELRAAVQAGTATVATTDAVAALWRDRKAAEAEAAALPKAAAPAEEASA